MPLFKREKQFHWHGLPLCQNNFRCHIKCYLWSTAYSPFFNRKRGSWKHFFQTRLGNNQVPVVQTWDGAVAAFDNLHYPPDRCFNFVLSTVWSTEAIILALAFSELVLHEDNSITNDNDRLLDVGYSDLYRYSTPSKSSVIPYTRNVHAYQQQNWQQQPKM